MQPTPETTHECKKNNYAYSTGTAALFLSARFFSWAGLTNVSFYMDAALALILATTAYRELNAYGPAKAAAETRNNVLSKIHSGQQMGANVAGFFKRDRKGAERHEPAPEAVTNSPVLSR